MEFSHIFGLLIALSLSTAVVGFGSPGNIIPDLYKLDIITNLGEDLAGFKFYGTVWIDVKCKENTPEIRLNCKDLRIDTEAIVVKPTNPPGDPLTLTNVHVDMDREELLIQVDGELQAESAYQIEIKFEGDLGRDLNGLYVTTYYSDEGGKKWLALTNLSPYYARRVFPCFDEPFYKTEFVVSIGRSNKYKSLFSMSLKTTEPMENKPGWEWDRYTSTPPMSTHMLSFIVSDFEFREMFSRGEDQSVKYKIWTRKSALQHTDYVREMIPLFTDFYEKYFDFPYPLPKMDMVGVPELANPSISGWGLMFFTEKYLLFHVRKSPLLMKETIASLVAHELAHQWFGNLVTVRWWSDIWLSEGFARFMATEAVEAIYPKWKTLNQELTDDILSVIAIDSLNSTHPVSVPIEQLNDIEEYFDTIEIRKGAYLLRMMSHFIDPRRFHGGILNYLTNSIFLNVDKDSMLTFVNSEAHRTRVLEPSLDVATIMDSWINKPGIPLLTVTRDYKKGTAEVKQERFFKDRTLLGTDNTKWWIPLTYTTECEMGFNNTKVKTWLRPDEESVTITDIGLIEWIILNIEAVGLYIVDYDKDNWDLIIDHMLEEPALLPTINRVLLIHDAYNLAWVGRMEYDTFFSLLDYLEQEQDFLPWKTALHCFQELDTLVKRTSVYNVYMGYIRGIIANAYERAGTLYPDPEATSESIHQSVQITNMGCKYQMESCIKAVNHILKNYREHLYDKDNADWSNDLSEVVLCYTVRSDGGHLWQQFWGKQLDVLTLESEKTMFIRAAGCIEDAAILKVFAESTLNETVIRVQDMDIVIQAVLANGKGFNAVREFLTENGEEVVNRTQANPSVLGSIINELAHNVINEEEHQWLESIVNADYMQDVPVRKSLLQALEISKLNVQWHEKNYESFEQYMSTTLKPKADEDQKDLIQLSKKMRAELMRRDEEE